GLISYRYARYSSTKWGRGSAEYIEYNRPGSHARHSVCGRDTHRQSRGCQAACVTDTARSVRDRCRGHPPDVPAPSTLLDLDADDEPSRTQRDGADTRTH